MKKQIAATGFTLLSLLLPLRAKAANLDFSQMYVFGDSLSDQGNVFNATQGNFPPSPYFEGRFSNGFNWIDYLAQDLGLTVNPLIGTAGTNFAFGGATTDQENTLSLTFPQLSGLPALQQQIATFTSLIPPTQTADPDALYVLWAGANDYLPTEGSFEPFENPEITLGNLSTALTALTGVGARNIMVVNLPQLGNTPIALFEEQQVPGTINTLNNLSEAHNAGLSQLLNQFGNDFNTNLTNLNLISLEVNSLFSQATSGELGFSNTTAPCFNFNAGSICNNPDEYLFWDAQHPTTAAHRLVANAALTALHPEDSTDSASVPESSNGLVLLAFGFFATSLLLKRQLKKN